MEVKTVVCPHCGANTTNTVNCDYCGSLFVRFADNGIDISNTSYLLDNIAFPELISEFKENMRLQKVNQTLGVATMVKIPKIVYQQGNEIEWDTAEIIAVKSGSLFWADNTQIQLGRLEGGICICLSFCDSLYYRKHKLTERHKKFKQLSSFGLFTHRTFTYSDEYESWIQDQYAIDFGQDAEGAAILVSEIMEKVYDIKPTDDYGIFTGVGTDPIERAVHWEAITQRTTEEGMGIHIQPTAPQQNYPANEAQSDDDFWSTTLPMTIVWIMLALIGIFCLVFFIKIS